MRDRVARKVIHLAAVTSRLVLPVVLVPVVLVAGAGAASANATATPDVAAASVPFGLGPVGIVAVVLGFGGLLAGLLRHRRRGGVVPSAVTVPVDASGTLPVLDQAPMVAPTAEPSAGERVG
ncbi:hypothetical protein [Actinophytocola xanthii]|uniref:Uncharacterized protein n=1 Tax=Actinophytocola xanthii TaxID=1912961 RepID=A0A1Q8CGW6_9PSEU|nr:hypothetical protein [Actinophytocola xanthii]OLF13573.1 hypothetical protein BU204_26350 [Actinophytocola xanthii]